MFAENLPLDLEKLRSRLARMSDERMRRVRVSLIGKDGQEHTLETESESLS
jgi:hypothetical protein